PLRGPRGGGRYEADEGAAGPSRVFPAVPFHGMWHRWHEWPVAGQGRFSHATFAHEGPRSFPQVTRGERGTPAGPSNGLTCEDALCRIRARPGGGMGPAGARPAARHGPGRAGTHVLRGPGPAAWRTSRGAATRRTSGRARGGRGGRHEGHEV